MIPASALAVTGMRPADTVQCPARIDIGGRTFHNFDFEQLGAPNLLNAFAVSCNTTFASLTAQRLRGGHLRAMAPNYGFPPTPHPPSPPSLRPSPSPAPPPTP